MAATTWSHSPADAARHTIAGACSGSLRSPSRDRCAATTAPARLF